MAHCVDKSPRIVDGLNLVIIPTATVPKSLDKMRVIVYSSFPPGHGVNDANPKNLYRGKGLFKYLVILFWPLCDQCVSQDICMSQNVNYYF